MPSLFSCVAYGVSIVAILFGFLATKFAPTPASDSDSLPPGSFGMPIMGETIDIFMGEHQWLDERFEEFGPVSRSYVMFEDAIVLGGLEGVKLFYDQSKFIRKDHQPSFIQRIIPSNVGSKYGDVHHAHKPIVMEALSEKVLDHALPEITKGAHALLGQLDSAEKVEDVNMLQATQLWNYDCLCLILFSEVDEDFKKIYPVLIEKFLTAVPLDVPGTTFNALANKVYDVVIPWMEDKVLQHMKNPENFVGDGTSAMIAANKKSDMPMSSVELAYELHHLFAAGMALNSPISNFLMTLEREPAVLAALRKESLATPYDPEIGITTDRVGNYPLLSAAYLESRRFNPSAKVNFARTRTAFNYTTLAGETYNIPQGWLTVLLLHSVHLDPANHDNPRTFKLERFQGQSDLEAVENFGVVSQGAGKPTGHLCAGWQLSGRLVRSLLVPLLREFRFSFHTNDEMPAFKPESLIAYASEVTLKEFESLSK